MKILPGRWGAVVVGLLVSWFSLCAVQKASAAALDIVGNVSYVPSDNEQFVSLQVDELANNSFGGYSGTIRLELWAFSTPFNGTQVGYPLASYQFGELGGGVAVYNIHSGWIPLVKPPPGQWYFSLLAREFVGGGGDGFVTRDYVNFPHSVRVAGGARAGDVDISGVTSWGFYNGNVVLEAESVKNVADLGTTSTLRLDLWATRNPYSGGVISGYRFSTIPLNPLAAGSYYIIDQINPYLRPPDGLYYVTMTISEYRAGQFHILDHVSFPDLERFGNPPPPLPSVPTTLAATKATLSSGVRLTWKASANAATYEVYRSTSNVASASSKIAQGLTTLSYLDTSAKVGVTYFYWVKARNVTGASAFSSGDYGIRNGSAPSIVSQPKNLNRLIGQHAGFAVFVNGTAPFQYQWTKDGVDLEGATTASLTITNLQLEHAGVYSVRVSNNYGNAESVDAKLGVFDPATLTPVYWQSTDRRLALWYMNGTNFVLSMPVKNGLPLPSGWSVRGFSDFDADEKTDLLLEHTDGRIMIWFLDGARLVANATIPKPATGWRVVGAAHMDLDVHPDILLRHKDGRMAVWHMEGTTQIGRTVLFNNSAVDNAFRFGGSGDFNQDGHTDLVWHHTNGRVFIWLMVGTELQTKVMLRDGTPTGMRLGAILDLNKDGHTDLLWQSGDRKSYLWEMDQTQFYRNILLQGGKPAAVGWQSIGPK